MLGVFVLILLGDLHQAAVAVDQMPSGQRLVILNVGDEALELGPSLRGSMQPQQQLGQVGAHHRMLGMRRDVLRQMLTRSRIVAFLQIGGGEAQMVPEQLGIGEQAALVEGDRFVRLAALHGGLPLVPQAFRLVGIARRRPDRQ